MFIVCKPQVTSARHRSPFSCSWEQPLLLDSSTVRGSQLHPGNVSWKQKHAWVWMRFNKLKQHLASHLYYILSQKLTILNVLLFLMIDWFIFMCIGALSACMSVWGYLLNPLELELQTFSYEPPCRYWGLKPVYVGRAVSAEPSCSSLFYGLISGFSLSHMKALHWFWS